MNKKSASLPVGESTPTISIEVYQQDWKPGFACFLDDGSIAEGGKAHVGLNLAAFLGTLKAGDIEAADLPYVIAESLMHEVIHVLESWAKVEFNEERVEALLRKYHDKYRPDAPVYEKCDPRPTPEEQTFGNSAAKKEEPLRPLEELCGSINFGGRYCGKCSDEEGNEFHANPEDCPYSQELAEAHPAEPNERLKAAVLPSVPAEIERRTEMAPGPMARFQTIWARLKEL